MALIWNRKSNWFALLSFVLFLIACSGGGSGSTSPTRATIAYTGSLEPALLSDANAVDLAVSSYGAGGMTSVTSIGFTSNSANPALASTNQSVPTQGHQLLRIIGGSVQDSGIYPEQDGPDTDGPDTDRPDTDRTPQAHVLIQETNMVYGECGGKLAVSFNVVGSNGSTNVLDGTFQYHDYCEDGVTLNGQGSLYGYFSSYSGTVPRLKLRFDYLSVEAPDGDYQMAGWMEVDAHASDIEIYTIDLIIHYPQEAKTYWMNDYTIVYTLGVDLMGIDVDGRYYNPDTGYVDISTRTTVGIDDLYDWPVQGELEILGEDDAMIRMTFNPGGYCRIEVDFDPDDQFDWKEDVWFITSQSGNLAPVADGGADVTVYQHETVVLDGGGSSDPEGGAITYDWSLAQCPDNACPTLPGDYHRELSFSSDVPGLYHVNLKVFDGQAESQPDEVVIEVVPINPTGVQLGLISDIVAGGEPRWMYAIDRENQALYYIDTQTRLITDTISLPEPEPVQMDYNAVDHRLYIVSDRSAGVTVVDVDSKALSTISLNETCSRGDVKVAPARRRIYVVCYNTIAIYDMDSHVQISETRIGQTGFMALDEANQFLYLNGYRTGKFTLANDQPEKLDSGRLSHYRKVNISPDGAHLLAIGSSSETLLDTDTNDLDSHHGQWILGDAQDISKSPGYAEFNPDGRVVYATSSAHPRLFVMDATTYGEIRRVAFPNANKGQTVFAANSDGTMVVGFSYNWETEDREGLYFLTDVQYAAMPES